MAARQARKSRALGWIALACACLAAASVASARSPSATQLRAVFVYKFTTMVDWPAQALGAAGDSFTICLLGSDPTDGEMQRTVAGQRSHDLAVSVVRIDEPSEEQSCQVVYVALEDSEGARGALDFYGDASTLTVGHLEDFAELGGMIELVKSADRMRFRINQAAVERAGLGMDSKLLRLAVDVLH